MRKILSFNLQKTDYAFKACIPFLLLIILLLQVIPTYSQTPGLITNITANTGRSYMLSQLNAGSALYTDRTYNDTSVPLFLKIKRIFKERLRTYQAIAVPGFLNNAPFIKTPNDDKGSKATSLLSFDLTKNATVYVAYDPRAIALPAWLSSWQKLTNTVSINDSKITYLELYSKNFSAGRVTLGGNLASPATGAMNNYFVAAQEQTSPALITNVAATTGHIYTLSKLNVDTVIYTDRIYKAISVPDFLKEAPFIKTPNDDKTNKGTSILSFNLTQSATVYIAYDPRATVLPAWLNSWQKLTIKVGINDPKINHLLLYSKSYPAGTVTLDGNLATPAAGALNNYIVLAVTAAQPAQYNLTVTTSGNGTVIKNPDQSSYANGTNVTLTATPAAGQQFTGWSGDATGTTNPLTILIDGNKSVTATFAPLQYSFTLTTSGNGTVTKNPDQPSYASGTNVTLTATPAAGQQFTGWSGDAAGTTNPLTILMDGNKSVTATFAPLQYSFTLTTSGNGAVTKNPDQPSYASGTNVTLTATPSAGQQFTGWSGDAAGTTNPLTILMDGNKSVTATFAPGSTKPVIFITPSTLYDNDVSLGAAGINRTVTVKNTGGGVLSLSSVSLFGTNANQFILSGLPASFPRPLMQEILFHFQLLLILVQ